MKGAAAVAKTQWYKEMTVYQIWIRSFCDGNGDGIGDLYGVLQKLDYIKSLGVDAIWFSPIYPSPNADFGYDISDYMDIHPDYGTLDTFREVLDRAHEMGLRVFMDLVVNHTSDEHPWFQESRKAHTNPYHDYYIWRHGRVSRGRRYPPNNWTSMFEGDAWEYDENLDEYYLHLFAKKQPDLNMANPKVREEVKQILRFWLEMGVDGFREDVITYIGKAPGLPDSFPKLPIANGVKYYSNQPEAHKYLKEFKRDVLDPAIKEINMYTDMMVMYEPLKTDLAGNKYRRYTSIRFSWILKSEGQLEDTDRLIDDEYQKIEAARVNHQYTLEELYGNGINSSLESQMDQLKYEQDKYESDRKRNNDAELREEEELDKRADASRYPAAVSEFGRDFSDDQLKWLFEAAFSILPFGMI